MQSTSSSIVFHQTNSSSHYQPILSSSYSQNNYQSSTSSSQSSYSQYSQISTAPSSSYSQYSQFPSRQTGKTMKKKPAVRKLRMFGEESDYEQKKYDGEENKCNNKNKHGFFYRKMLTSFFDITETIIHMMKFVYDYLFCCKLICFILRTDPATQRRRLVEHRNLINKASMSQALTSPSSSSTYSTSILTNNNSNNYNTSHDDSFFASSLDNDTEYVSTPTSSCSYSSIDCLKMYEDKKNTLVLDLDETLIHCDEKSLNDDSQMITVQYQEQQKNYHLHQRSFLQDFLEQCAMNFNIIIFTASTKDYAEEVVKQIDPRNLIKKVYDRSSCFFDGKQYNKDLRVLKVDLHRTVMIDNSQACVSNNSENAIKIKDFFFDKNDKELQKYSQILNEMSKLPGSFKDFIQNYQS